MGMLLIGELLTERGGGEGGGAGGVRPWEGEGEEAELRAQLTNSQF